MEYENMRMPELKSLARDRGLRNYSRMSKVELIAFLTIWVRIIISCVGQKADISILRWGIKYCQWQHFTYSRKSLISDFFRGKLHMYYIRLKPHYSFN